MSNRRYGDLEVLGDSACPKCRESGGDRTGNHLVHYKNTNTGSEFCRCGRCGYIEKITDDNRADLESVRHVQRELSDEEYEEIMSEARELPFADLESRGITQAVAERFGVRVGLSSTDGYTPVSHFYPKTKDQQIQGYKVRNLDPKYFYSIGRGRDSDLFGIQQAQLGDVYSGHLFIFEDELSCMSGFQIITQHGKSAYKPACVSLPDGAGSAAAVLSRNQNFVQRFNGITICMDNDKAGEEAVQVIRKIYPEVKIARVPKDLTFTDKATGEIKPVKDVNDMLMAGESLTMFNLIRYSANKESPAMSVGVMDCLEDALKKPEWGFEFPWKALTDMTYGMHLGEVIAVGGGVGG